MDSIEKHLQELGEKVASGRMNRRQFLAAASAAGMAASAPLFYREAMAQTPKSGGKLTAGLGHGSTTDSLDPGTWENDFMIMHGYGVHGYLTEIDSDNQLVPELAQSWSASPDAKVWTFELRSGVTFHNGKTFTAQDAVNTLNFHRAEGSTSAVKALLKTVTDIKADGDKTLKVTLSEGNVDFPSILSEYHFAIIPAAGDSIDWQSGIGCGAYVLKSFDQGVRAQYQRNPNYWKEGRGHFDEVEAVTIADVSSRTNALTTGEIDYMDRCDTKTVHLLERNPDVNIIETSGNGHYSMPMRTNQAPFNDNNIRLALKYAIDREAMLKKVLRGHGYLGNDSPIGRGNAYYNVDLPQKSYDPDKAKYYLKQAGVSSLKVELAAADAAYSGGVDSAILFQESAAKIGITIDVARVPNDGYWSNVWNTDNYKWALCYWVGRPTEDQMFSVAYSDGAEWNDTNWSHARFNVLLKQARVELEDNKRREIYYEMQQIVSDEGGTLIPVFNNFVAASTKKVATPSKLASNTSNDGNRFMERWWFAS